MPSAPQHSGRSPALMYPNKATRVRMPAARPASTSRSASPIYRHCAGALPAWWQKGRWVVADRYITDLRYLYKSEPMFSHPLLRYWACKLFPKPDLFIFLDNESDVIHARKPQLTVEEITRSRLHGLRAIRPYPHEIIRTDQSPETIADHILSRVVQLSAGK